MNDTPKIQRFSDLKVWQEAHKSVLLIYGLCKKFPSWELYGLSAQMRRAAVSISSNVVEVLAEKDLRKRFNFIIKLRDHLLS
jgi:four helix bundle protein